MIKGEGASSYIHPGIHDNDGHFHDDIPAPTRSVTRCTTTYISKDMHEHALDLEGHGITSRTVHRHTTNHFHTCELSKQHALRAAAEGHHTELSTSTLTGAGGLLAVCS